MDKSNLAKLLAKIDKDNELSELGHLDDNTKQLLQKMADGKIEADQAIEIFLEKNQDYKK